MLPPEILTELVAYSDTCGLRNLRASSRLFCSVFTPNSFGTFLVKDKVQAIHSRCAQLGHDYRTILPYMRSCEMHCGYAADEDGEQICVILSIILLVHDAKLRVQRRFVLFTSSCTDFAIFPLSY